MTRDTVNERETVNRQLAEWLEPFASLPPATEPSIMDQQLVSPRGAWICEMVYEDGDKPFWRPRNFYIDETANAMIVEKTPAHPPAYHHGL